MYTIILFLVLYYVDKVVILAQRITIMLDDDLSKKIRQQQAKVIKDTNSSVSFSHMINEILRAGLKN